MLQGRIRVLLLMFADLASICLCWIVVIWGYRAIGMGYYAFGVGFYLQLWPVGIAFVVLNCLMGLYHRSVLYPAAPINPVEELRRLVSSSVIVHISLVAALAFAYQSTEHYSRAVMLISGLMTAVIAQPVRDVLRLILKRLDFAQMPVELIGKGEVADHVAEVLARDSYLGFRLAQEGSHIAVVCMDLRLFQLEMADLGKRYTHVVYVPNGKAFPVSGAQTVSIDGIGALELVNLRSMRTLRVEKWLLDRLLALFAFVILSPFFVIVPILIKATSRGPVFYRQERLGRGGRRFWVWKFRSMHVDSDQRLQTLLTRDSALRSEWEANVKLNDDPRVTMLGKWLRKTSIDEFPQLFNVFAGDMALVGPRPIVEREVPLYGTSYEIFSSVDPGITGLWQVSGRSNTDYARRVALDTYYVLNWSPWLDVWILFRTVGAVLFMRGAC